VIDELRQLVRRLIGHLIRFIQVQGALNRY
jgi:hypothetical protein